MSERLLALAVLGLGGTYLALSLLLPRGTGARPGPGFFPLAVGLFLCAVAAAFVIATFRRQSRAAVPPARVSWDARARVAVTAGALVGFCLLLPWLGYPAVAFGFVALLIRWLGGDRWPIVLGTALASVAASHYLFARLLGVPLPRSPWFG